jgi:electron transfer flavoprotein alpha/beta subunit
MTALVLVRPGDPTSEIALEIALRLRPGAVVAAGVGEERLDAPLRAALAVGADKAIRLAATADSALGEVAVIARLATEISPSLILCGARRGRLGTNPVGPALADLLGLPHVGSLSHVGDPRATEIHLARRREGMVDSIACPLPAVLSVEWGPPLRYPTLPGRLRARRSDIEVVHGAVESEPALELLRRTGPKPRRKLAQRTGSAMDHVFGMLLGGATGDGSGRRLEGDPADVGAQIVAACLPILRSV